MSYHFEVLTPKNGFWFRSFTFPLFQGYLGDPLLGTRSPIIAIGMFADQKPAGLVMARILPDEDMVEILSILIEKNLRHQGYAPLLISELETELRKKNYTRLKVEFERGRPITQYLDALLAKCGFPEAEVIALIGRCHNYYSTNIPWIRRNLLPKAYQILPWVEISDSQKQQIQQTQQENPWYPEILSPFNDEPIIEPLNSLALFSENTVIGWMITHRMNPQTIRYTSLFVREDLKNLGLGIPLMGEALKRHFDEGDPIAKQVTFITYKSMPDAVHFFQKRMRRHLDELNESVQSVKHLDS